MVGRTILQYKIVEQLGEGGMAWDRLDAPFNLLEPWGGDRS
jgi:hypothetical protein